MIFKRGKIDIEQIFYKIASFSGIRKIDEISKYFLGTPYKKNSLIGSFQKEQLVVDFEGVDCMSFIEYVESLRLSFNFESFIENLKTVRYFDSIVNFEKRRHFFTDWKYLKSVKDATDEIGKENVKKVMKELNKKNEGFWIEGLPVKKRTITYIPVECIEKIAFSLNTGDYCGFYTSKLGLDVVHTGIIIKDENFIMLRHASSISGMVVEEDFLSYSKNKEGIIIFRPLD
uniref:DUF1460 domain-containing protein n=1 Tax=Thermodesulfovibrio aggregans TaxID=86166 RepID=A0A7C4ENH6_9BACT